jgi:recombination protein RecT
VEVQEHEEDWKMTTTNAPATTGTRQTQALTRDQQQRMTLRRLFDQQKPELAKLMPRGMDAERLFRMALTECIKNPLLLDCSAESWALAIQTCAAQGLYPDSGLGYMYLIPRSKAVTAQRGYQGDIALVRRSGEISDIWAEVVYEKDHYKVTKGLDRNIIHEPTEEDDPGKLRACYAVAKLRNGDTTFVTLTRADVMRHKASSLTASRADGPWIKHEAAMWKKTAIHELVKWLPKSSEQAEQAARAILDDGDARAIETTAVDLGRAELPSAPSEPEKPATLDQLAEQLAPADCDHAPAAAERAKSLPIETVTCTACGEVLPGLFDQAAADRAAAASERQPGEDDGDDEAARVAEVKRLADAAKAKPRAERKPVEG